MKDTVLHAQIDAKGCTAELWLNDVPIARITPERTPFESAPVEEYAIPGGNRLEILIEPGSRPSLGRGEQRQLDLGDATVVARLVRFHEGDIVEPQRGDVLGEVRFDRPPGWSGPRRFPESRSIDVDLGAANGRWGWQDAPLLTLDDALVTEADGVLEALADAFRTLSSVGLYAISELQIADVLRAYPAVSAPLVREDLDATMALLSSVPERALPRDPSRYDFRLVAGGRMMECVDVDYRPSLWTGDPSGEPSPCRTLLARIDGRLRLVR